MVGKRGPAKPAPKKGKPNAGKKVSRPDWKPAFLAALAATGNITASCDRAGIDRDTFYVHRDRDPEFRAKMRRAIGVATEALEGEARRRAYEGLLRKKFGKGGEPLIDPDTGEQYAEREYSDTLLIFLLKAHKPRKYRERKEVEHKGKVTHRVVRAEDMDDDHLATIAAGDGGGSGGGTAPPA